MLEFVGEGEELTEKVVQWTAENVRCGLQLLVVEGLPHSGKTTLAVAIQRAIERSEVIHLDDFLNGETEGSESWTDIVVRRGGVAKLQRSLSSAQGLLILDGTCAAEVKNRAGGTDRTGANIYVRKLSTSGGWRRWADGEALDPAIALAYGIERSVSNLAIMQYHRLRQPWLTADLVVSRLERKRVQ